MLKLKTIEQLVKKYNEENEVNIELVYTRFDYWENVLSVELEGQTVALARHEINKTHHCSVLNTDLNKEQVMEKLNLLYLKVKQPEKYEKMEQVF